MTDKTATLADIRAAIETLTDDDKTSGGAFRMASLNDALEDAGFDHTTADRRDLALTGMDDGPEGAVEITLDAAQMNPVTIYVHGIGHCSIRIGETKSLPKEAVEVIERLPDTKFTITEEKGE